MRGPWQPEKTLTRKQQAKRRRELSKRIGVRMVAALGIAPVEAPEDAFIAAFLAEVEGDRDLID